MKGSDDVAFLKGKLDGDRNKAEPCRSCTRHAIKGLVPQRKRPQEKVLSIGLWRDESYPNKTKEDFSP